MKAQKLLLLGLGVVIGGGLSIAGLSTALAGSNKQISDLISEEKAKAIMMEKVPGATITEFSLDNDDNAPKYDGRLVKDNYEYEVDVDAGTGAIIEFEKEKIDSTDVDDDDNNINDDKDYDDDADDNYDDDRYEDSSNNSNSSDNNQTTSGSNTSKIISESEAKSIMLSKVEGATIKYFEFDNDSTPEYEAELVKGNYEYDITVDAKTGKITEFSKEAIDNDNDDNDNDNDDDKDND